MEKAALSSNTFLDNMVIQLLLILNKKKRKKKQLATLHSLQDNENKPL